MYDRRAIWEKILDDHLAASDSVLWNGDRKKLADAVGDLIPTRGAAPADKPKLEAFRKLQNIYYDIYNNGGGNCCSDLNDDTPAFRARWGFSRSTMCAMRSNAYTFEKRVQRALEAAAIESGIDLTTGKANES